MAAPKLEGLRFDDVTAAAGLDFPQAAQPLSQGESMTGGVAACDFFGNGLTDLYVTRVGLPNELFRNNGNGTFTDIASSAGVQGPDWKDGYAAATCGDLNGDGRPDIYVTGAGNAENVLYINNGNGTFTDDTAEAGLTLPPIDPALSGLMYGSAFGDINHDGRLDLVTLEWDVSSLLPFHGMSKLGEGLYGSGMAIASGSSPPKAYSGPPRTVNPRDVPTSSGFSGGVCNVIKEVEADIGAHLDTTRSRLYLNEGNSPDGVPHFKDVTSSFGLDFNDVLGFQPIFVDLNNDGWDDLVITGDACTSQVYLNEHGKRFVNVTEKSHAGTAENGMGSVFADFKGNGLPDWFETSISYPGTCPTPHTLVGCSGNRLYVNLGNGKFTDKTDTYGVRDGGWGWGAVAEDFTNDGFLSIFQVDGMLWEPSQLVVSPANPLRNYYKYFSVGTPRLWLNSGSAPFVDVAHQVGITTTGEEKAVVPIDVLNDGRVGLFITDTGSTPVLYENDSVNNNGWVTVRLHDNKTANRFGVGAKVRVLPTRNAKPQEAELLDSGSFESSNPLELHFGLGPGVSSVYEIDVYWPGDPVAQTLHDVAADRVIDITRN